MNEHPYRTAAAVVAAQRPWWQRALATLPAFACSWSRSYRRARGGRWSLIACAPRTTEEVILDFCGEPPREWRRVDKCPGVKTASRWGAGCFCGSEKRCRCEVWTTP